MIELGQATTKRMDVPGWEIKWRMGRGMASDNKENTQGKVTRKTVYREQPTIRMTQRFGRQGGRHSGEGDNKDNIPGQATSRMACRGKQQL